MGHKGPWIWCVIEGPPLVGLVRSEQPAAVALVDCLLAKAPAKLVPAAIVAACTPTSIATALKLLDAHPSATLDAASVEPLLAKDSERLKKLVLDASCTPLVETLCGKSAAIKAAVASPAMLCAMLCGKIMQRLGLGDKPARPS